MKILLSGLMLGMLGLVATARSQDAPTTLNLDEVPTYKRLVDSGIKFLMPSFGIQLGHDGNLPRDVQFKSEPVNLVLISGKAKSIPLGRSSFGVSFPVEQLAEPGKYYPPTLPVQDSTKVSIIGISFQEGLKSEEAGKLISSLVPVLNLDASKVRAWTENRLWESAPEYVLKGTVSKGVVTVQLNSNNFNRPADQTTIALIIRLEWEKDPVAEAAFQARQSASRPGYNPIPPIHPGQPRAPASNQPHNP